MSKVRPIPIANAKQQKKMASDDKSTSSASNKSIGKNKPPTQEQILSRFNQLRQEQRSLALKVAELEMELNEHNLVVDTLKEVDANRKCFRMVGGVLVARTVKEVLPALINNKEQLGTVIESLNQQIVSKGKEIQDYREKHNIRIRSQDELLASIAESQQKGAAAQGVLVSNKN
uniref:Prefoldin subunit 2 n=1 Tax=Strigamia maritima TaxID=126957 RepID=T1IHB3_STRMM